MTKPTILVLHGITMNGASMLHTLGPLAGALEAAGYELVAPDGGRQMSRPEVESFVGTIAGAYSSIGSDASDYFSESKFWDAENHFDWLDSTTDEASGKKTYDAFDASLESVRTATRDRDVRGILGFSQGCVWAAIVTALARRGELSFGDSLSFGMYLSGFLPTFDVPAVELWPVKGELQSHFVMGTKDPLFTDARGTVDALAEVFPETNREVSIVEGLGHDVSRDPALIDALVGLASRNL